MLRLNSIRNCLRFPKPALANKFSTSSRTLQSSTVGTSSATVEDMHDLSAEDILKESGDRKDADLRHFTGGLEYLICVLTAHCFVQSTLGAFGVIATHSIDILTRLSIQSSTSCCSRCLASYSRIER